jgi:hypothetical protein
MCTGKLMCLEKLYVRKIKTVAVFMEINFERGMTMICPTCCIYPPIKSLFVVGHSFLRGCHLLGCYTVWLL